MCKILSRLKTLADTEGISIGSIERAIGASRGVISKAISKGTDIQSKWLELICKHYPQYSPTWLLTGEGSMLREVAYVPPTQHHPSKPAASAKVITQNPQKLSPLGLDTVLIDRFMATIKEQAEEIGALKARIKQLESEGPRKNNPSYAPSMKPETVET